MSCMVWERVRKVSRLVSKVPPTTWSCSPSQPQCTHSAMGEVIWGRSGPALQPAMVWSVGWSRKCVLLGWRVHETGSKTGRTVLNT